MAGGTAVCFLRQSRDGAVQQTIEQQPKGTLDLSAVGVAQATVKSAEQFAHHLTTLRLEILRQAGDHRTMTPPRPILEERLRFVVDDCLGWLDVFETIGQRSLADAFQIVDVEQAGAIAVVDARSKLRGTAMSRMTSVPPAR